MLLTSWYAKLLIDNVTNPIELKYDFSNFNFEKKKSVKTIK